jgi:hypothetical protein
MKIAFGYKMGTGKDVCVKYLINKYGGMQIRFADAIYDILNYAQKRCGIEQKKDRKFLQLVGTEWGRSIDNDIWIKVALKNQQKDCNIYCSDLRFKNEFDALKNDGFIMVKLIRNKINQNRKGNGSCNHISENELDEYEDYKWDYVILNNGNLEELYDKLDIIVNKTIKA